MRRAAWWAVLLLSTYIVALLMLRTGAPPPAPIAVAAPPAHRFDVKSTHDYDGFVLTARAYAVGSTLYAEATLVNHRGVAVPLVSDRCGHASTATLLVPPGAHGRYAAWFAAGTRTPFTSISRCGVARMPVVLAPGATHTERWRLGHAAGERTAYVLVDLVTPTPRLRALLPVILTVPVPTGHDPRVKVS